jgi:CcmD family protein
VDNFSYLFWAYVIFWIALFIYVYSLLKKSKELKKEMDALKGSLNNEKLTRQRQRAN